MCQPVTTFQRDIYKAFYFTGLFHWKDIQVNTSFIIEKTCDFPKVQ